MRKLALLAAVCAAAVMAGGVAAAPSESWRIAIHDSFNAPFMSAACGVPVVITIDGVAEINLRRNAAGLVASEHDTTTTFTAVFSSPTSLGGTGMSFTNHSPSVVFFDYGSGAAIGSTAVVTLTGLQGPAAGSPSSITAGYQRLTGTVYGFSEEGVPLVDFDGPVIAQHGVWPDFFDVILPERCAALGGSVQM